MLIVLEKSQYDGCDIYNIYDIYDALYGEVAK